MPTAREISVTEHLRKIPAGVRPAVQAARRTVKAVAPQASEIICQSQPPRSAADADRPAVKRLLQRAFKLGGGRE